MQGQQSASFVPVQQTNAAADYSLYKVIRRDGTAVPFQPTKISVALTKAFIATEGEAGSSSSRVHDLVAKLTQQVVDVIVGRQPQGGTIRLETIQDQVELVLMRSGEHDVARRYVLYRDARAQERARQVAEQTGVRQEPVHVSSEDSVRSDALSALVNLGYQRSAAEKAIDAALNEGGDITVESILRRTLKKLARV